MKKLKHREMKWLVGSCTIDRTELTFEHKESGSRTCSFRGLLHVPSYSLPLLCPIVPGFVLYHSCSTLSTVALGGPASLFLATLGAL